MNKEEKQNTMDLLSKAIERSTWNDIKDLEQFESENYGWESRS